MVIESTQHLLCLQDPALHPGTRSLWQPPQLKCGHGTEQQPPEMGLVCSSCEFVGRFQVDWLHGGLVRNSLWRHFNFSCQGCSSCGCLGPRKPNPREPWAIFRGSTTSVLHSHTRNYFTFRPKTITLDTTFKNPRRNSAIIQNPLNEPPTSTFDKHAKRTKLGLDRQEFDWCIINSASWVTKRHSSISYYWNMISSLQLQTKIIGLIPKLYHSNYDANLL